jgi:hypothetical protein
VLEHAGLWGDGDEIEAIELVEKRLNVSFRDDEAADIWTVGDLWRSLLDSNPKLKNDRRSWFRFVAALTAYQGVNPREIGEQTLLIDPGNQNVFKHLWALITRKKSNV